MKILDCINDFHTVCGNSYRVTTDKGDYQIGPQINLCICIGLIEYEEELHNGSYLFRYYKGIEVPFRKKSIFGKKVYTADDIVKNILEFMKKRPNEFEALFNKTAKPANKRSNYPHVSIRKFKI